jgi:hypothetical protein
VLDRTPTDPHAHVRRRFAEYLRAQRALIDGFLAELAELDNADVQDVLDRGATPLDDAELDTEPAAVDDVPQPVEAPKPAAAKPRTRAAKTAAPAARTRPAPAPEPEPDEAPAQTYAEAKAELESTDVDELRAIALSLDYDDDAVADASVSDLVEAILSERFPGGDPAAAGDDEPPWDADDAADSASDDADDDDAQLVTREELVGMSLGALRKLAAQVEIPRATYASLTQPELVDLLVAHQDAAMAEQDAATDDDDDDEADGEVWTREDLARLSRGELLALAKEYGVTKIPATATSDEIIDLIFEAA